MRASPTPSRSSPPSSPRASCLLPGPRPRPRRPHRTGPVLRHVVGPDEPHARRRPGPSSTASPPAGVGLVRQYIWWDRIETRPGSSTGAATDRWWPSRPPGAADPAHAPLHAGLLLVEARRLDVDRAVPPERPAEDGPTSPSDGPPLRTRRLVLVHAEPGAAADAAARRTSRCGRGRCGTSPTTRDGGRAAPNAAEYLDRLQAVAAGIRAADADRRGRHRQASPTNRSRTRTSTQLYELGAAPHFDTIAINPYSRDIATAGRAHAGNARCAAEG